MFKGKPVPELTDAELCREGAEYMGWTVSKCGWTDRDGRFVFPKNLLAKERYGLPMLMRIGELIRKNSPNESYSFHGSPDTFRFSSPTASAEDANPQRAILMVLVEAGRKAGR